MSNTEPNPQVEQLLEQGIKAAHSADKAAARALLEKVVELDEHSEKGWFWLAAVTDDIEEKKICLGNVLVINPDNQRARSLLEQLEGAFLGERAALLGQGKNNVNRKEVYLAIGLGSAAVIILIVLLVAMLGGGKKKPESPVAVANNTRQAGGNAPNATLAETTGPPTITPVPRPATWTPAPSSTPTLSAPPTLFAPPPSTLRGEIIMRSGEVIADPNNEPIVLIGANGSAPRTITPLNARGHSPALSPDSSEYVYVLYAPGTREELLQIDNIQGTDPRTVSSYWAGSPTLLNQNNPGWLPDGSGIVFVARGMESATADLYRLSLANPKGDPKALERLTTDDAIESWPSYSPDGQQIVYSADLSMMYATAGTELRIYDTVSAQITTLTNNGADLIEAAPDWSPDGATIVFQGKARGASGNDIFQMPASGASPAEKIIDTGGDDIQPRFSPDGQYIVFSSNGTGNWDVFIYEIATRNTYQLTTSPHTDIANDWGP
jgi:WD40 repeat protein